MNVYLSLCRQGTRAKPAVPIISAAVRHRSHAKAGARAATASHCSHQVNVSLLQYYHALYYVL